VSPSRDRSPYVGPRPFEREDGLLFGRDREVRELVSLVVAHRVVLLYAASGAGKTSLLNAGLMPALEVEEGFEVLPVGRLRPLDPELAMNPAVRNVFTAGVTSNWSRDVAGDDHTDALSDTLAAVLARREHATDAAGFPAPRLVVFDQFEELFSLFAERWRDREAFLRELAEALDDDPVLRVVLALREDFLAQLDAHEALLPGGLRTRLRMERLGPAAARAAAEGPLEGTGRAFADGAAEKLIGDLRTVRVDRAAGGAVEIEGEFVEPVHLQVACQSLWSELPAGVTTITEDHLRTFGNVDESLSRFYDDAVRRAAGAAGMSERRLRRSLEEAFLTAGGTRATVYRGASSTAGIPNRAIDDLENRHLLRAEWRAGARWYELTHDRLVEPLQLSNQAYAAAASRRSGRRLLAVGGVVMLSALAAAGAATVLSGPDPMTPPRPSAAFRSVDVEPGVVTFSEYLVRIGASPSEHQPQADLPRKGVVVNTSVALEGGRRFPFRTQVVADPGRSVVGESTEEEPLSAAAGRGLIEQPVWIERPQAAGRYRAILRIFPPGSAGSAGPLDSFETGTFAGLDGTGQSVTLEVSVLGNGAVGGQGVSCPRTCRVRVAPGTRFTLNAAPGPGSRFVRWTDPCGSSPTCTFTVSARTSITASFSEGRG